MKKYIVLFVIFLLLLSNLCWLKLYTHEHTKLKHALIPTLEQDYFTRQKIITTYQIQKENNHINLLNPILEIKLGNTLPYNFYFQTKENYGNFRKENTNQKEVPLIIQNPDYPNGCESASSVMFLNYLGIDITLKDFINNNLEKENVYENDGNRYGPDPAKSYAGDPASPNRGWGAFEPVISKAIAKVIENSHLKNELLLIPSETNKYPLYFLAASEYPSIIWVTIDYQEANDIYNWFSYDKKFTYTYPKNSHTVLLTGMDENYYYINDPLKEEKNIPIPKEQLESSFDSMGRQYIAITKTYWQKKIRADLFSFLISYKYVKIPNTLSPQNIA